MRFNNPDFRDSSFMRLKVLDELRSSCLLNDKLSGCLCGSRDSRRLRQARQR